MSMIVDGMGIRGMSRHEAIDAAHNLECRVLWTMDLLRRLCESQGSGFIAARDEALEFLESSVADRTESSRPYVEQTEEALLRILEKPKPPQPDTP